MHMLREAFLLWKRRRSEKSPTLQRRLILFFALVVISVILMFTLLLTVFGITGSGRQAVFHYLESELKHISGAVEDDFGNLSVTGVGLAQTLSEQGDDFFEENNLSPEEFARDREQMGLLLEHQFPTLLSVANSNACGGVFIVLDGASDDNRYSGIFIKKTQPVSSASIAAKVYYLRGPADIAREHSVELLGQWQMEYADSELDFFHTVMETAKEHPDLPLSRLYYWSDRSCLNRNSEEGLLLCLPLRSAEGTVFGVCGIEVSDRMFKQLYSPSESTYQGTFSIVAPLEDGVLCAQNGLIAGNSYLTGNQLKEALTLSGTTRGFSRFTNDGNAYGGLSENLRLYPSGSPYEGQSWTVAVLVPGALLERAIHGNATYLFLIVTVLLAASLVACVFISKRYLRPIQEGIASIREKAYETETVEFGILEIDSLFEDLARDIRAHREAMEQLLKEKQDAQEQYEKARSRIGQLVDKSRDEIDLDDYARFLQNLAKLTATERKIFDLYLDGKYPRDILELLQIKENTLKYHNRNIFGKLGVTSRKHLLSYAAIMEQQAKERMDGH